VPLRRSGFTHPRTTGPPRNSGQSLFTGPASLHRQAHFQVTALSTVPPPVAPLPSARAFPSVLPGYGLSAPCESAPRRRQELPRPGPLPSRPNVGALAEGFARAAALPRAWERCPARAALSPNTPCPPAPLASPRFPSYAQAAQT